MEIVKGVHYIECPYPPPMCFTSVVAIVDDEITLIDAGMPESPEIAIFPYLRKIGREPNEIANVILTHGHEDHFAGLPSIKEVSGAKIYVHELDKPLVEDIWYIYRELQERFPDIYGADVKPEVDVPPLKVDHTLSDGDKLDVGRPLRILHTPGHADGAICILVVDEGLLISGDSIQGMGEGSPLIFGSVKEYRESMKKLNDSISNYEIRKLALGHPYPPFRKGKLDGQEVKDYLRQSLIAIDEAVGSVYNLLQKGSNSFKFKDIQAQLNTIPADTIGCILEYLTSEGKINHIENVNGHSWAS